MDTPSMEQAHRYVYPPLTTPSNIRVVRLSRGRNNTLQCHFEETDVADGGSIALSYAWGTSDRTFRIQVVGRHGKAQGYIPLITALRNALDDISATKSLRAEKFWIDQLCIDQDNTSERNQQVAMMGKIYRNASRVITYLGPRQIGDDAAMRLLRDITRHFSHLPDEWAEIPGFSASVAPFAIEKQNPAWTRLVAIATGPWCQRMWMIQENLLNTNTSMLWGNNLISWNAIASIKGLSMERLLPPFEGSLGARFLHSSRNRDTLYRNASHLFSTGHSTSEVDFTSTQKGHILHYAIYPEPRTLGNFLANSMCHSCSDPRDKIFGLLGIATDSEQLGIVVDYEKPISEVYVEAALAIMREERNLSLLCYTNELGQRDLNLPRWVPAWKLNIWDRVLAYGRASGDTEIRWAAHREARVLSLNGIHVDTLTHNLGFMPSLRFIATTQDVEKLVVASCRLMAQKKTIFEHLGSESDKWEILGSSVLDNPYCFKGSEWDDVSAGHAMKTFWHYMNRRLNAHCEPSEAYVGTPTVDDEVQPHPAVVAELFAANAIEGRKFYLTEKKRICLVPKNALPGDVAVVLYGGHLIYILRPREENFEFIGTAYIHGLMEGQALEDPTTTTRDFHII